MPPNRFESEVGNFLEGSHGDRTHIKRAGHHTVTPLCGTLLMRGRFRYKTLPASGLGRPTRYKTLPASPKTPISAHFAPAGRTLYRFRHQHDKQGELYPARRATSGTKLALPPGSPAHPVQNSPSTPGSAAHPVQNSPSEPQNADFGPLFACRENFLPLPPPTRRAGRKKSRTNTPPHPNNVPLSKFRMQFDCLNFQ